MSTNSELRARLARLGPIQDMIPARSSSAALEPAHLQRTGPLDQPVTLFRRLFDEGITARAAKDAIDALAKSGETICSLPDDTDMSTLARDLAEMNVLLKRRRRVADPGALIIDIRTRHGLSQRQFADRLGIDMRTLQNWEQGRNRPDGAVLSLIMIFDRNPTAVDNAIYQPVVVEVAPIASVA